MAISLAACGGGDDGTSTNTTDNTAATQTDGETTDGGATTGTGEHAPVTLVWWHNGTTEPYLSYWQGIADEYKATHPWVTFDITPIQNEDLQTKIIAALQGGDASSIFAQWGAKEGADQFNAGYLVDITEAAADEIAALGSSAEIWAVDGHQYGLPYTFGIGGIYYNKDAFAAAGVEIPTTFDELLAAVPKLRDSGIAPIAIGAMDEWPVGHWYYWLALRECSREVIENDSAAGDFSNACWLRAAEDLKKLADTNPWQDGFMSTSAQQGAGSSAGQLANGQAAMELMGVWEPAVLKDLVEPKGELSFELGWFPFPAVTGGEGDPAAAQGAGDGFSCYAKQDAAAIEDCVGLLKSYVTVENAKKLNATGAGIAALPGAEDSIEEPSLQQVSAATAEAAQKAYILPWMDKMLGNAVGGALNTACTELIGGVLDPQGVIDAMTDAAA
jgi:raffinose/stachyose/melibiose transport system substrate-binding protein